MPYLLLEKFDDDPGWDEEFIPELSSDHVIYATHAVMNFWGAEFARDSLGERLSRDLAASEVHLQTVFVVRGLSGIYLNPIARDSLRPWPDPTLEVDDRSIAFHVATDAREAVVNTDVQSFKGSPVFMPCTVREANESNKLADVIVIGMDSLLGASQPSRNPFHDASETMIEATGDESVKERLRGGDWLVLQKEHDDCTDLVDLVFRAVNYDPDPVAS